MMRSRLPPLFSLQVFEASGRLGSFSLAARELHLTQSAVSRQIQVLEIWCGQTLFQRLGPRVSLLPAGEALLQRMSEPLQLLHRAVYPQNQGERLSLTINTLPSIARALLLPALAAFQHAHPLMDVCIHTEFALVQPPPQLPIIALRHGAQPPRSLHSEKLFADALQPFARADVLQKIGRNPENWPAAKLLRHTHGDWRLWADAYAPDLPIALGVSFNDASLVLDAAAAGLGVALVRQSIATHYLTNDAGLLPASAHCVASTLSTFAVCRTDCLAMPAVQLGLAWLRSLK